MAEFETKDSGARQEFASGMKRDTEEGKARFDLLVPEGVPYSDQLLTRFAELMARGAVKYDARNWEQADSMDEVARAKSSAFRHFMQWFCGERDEDHAAATLFNIMVVETIEPRAKAAIADAKINAEFEEALGLANADGMIWAVQPDAEVEFVTNPLSCATQRRKAPFDPVVTLVHNSFNPGVELPVEDLRGLTDRG